MLRPLSFLLGACLAVNAGAASVSETALITGLQQRHEEAKSMEEFLGSLNEFLPENRNFVLALLGPEFLAPPPAMKFDAKAQKFTVADHTVEFKNATKGTYVVDGAPFTYDRKISFGENVRNFSRAMAGTRKTSQASPVDFFLPRAYAAPENWMSLSDKALEGAPGLAMALSPVPAALGIGYQGLSNLSTGRAAAAGYDVSWQKAEARSVRNAGLILATVGPLYWATERAHAYLATPFCSKQVADLKKILTAQKLSLTRFSCGDPAITFKNAGGGMRSFTPYWRAGALVDNQMGELYSFTYDALKSVTRKEVGSGKGGYRNVDGARVERPVLKEYRAGDSVFEAKVKELEPYRQVLFYMGKNLSCTKCENEIVVGLTETAAGKPTGASANSPSGNPTDGQSAN